MNHLSTPWPKIAPEGTYSHSQRCPNCNHNNEMQIPKGTAISEFLNSFACTACGCNIGKLLRKLWA